MLAGAPGIFLAGELHYLWDENVRANHRCGCGQPFRDCPFWTAVGDHAFGGWKHVDVEEGLRRAAARTRHALLLAAPRLAPRFAREMSAYAALLSPVYQAIAASSDSQVIIDTSKLPSTGYLLRHVPGVDVKLIHLVRSPYGVVYSWQKTVARQDGRPGGGVPDTPPRTVATEWPAFNTLLDGLRLLSVPTSRLRYEASWPPPGGDRAVVGLPASAVNPRRTLSADHSLSGNQMKSQTRRITLRLDDQWRTGLPADTRRMVSAITAPVRWRYGY